MSIEFQSSRPVEQEDYDALCECVRDNCGLTLIETSGARFSFRLKDAPVRPSWPEDVELVWESGRVLIIVHSLDRRHRTTLLDAATTCMASRGLEVDFEEV